MQTFDISSLARVTTRNQGKKLLAYFHNLNQAKHKADLHGYLLLKKEAQRVREKILFAEALA